MIFIYFIISLFIWAWYSKVEGETEAYLFYYWLNSKIFNIKNLHPMWWFKRVLVGVGLNLPILFLKPQNLGIILFPVSLVCYGIIFPFFHDGFYYIQRNNLDNRTYEKRFKEHSTSSSAKMEFDWITRLCFFVIGAVILIIIGVICLNQN